MPEQLFGSQSPAARTILSEPAARDPNRYRAIARWSRRLARDDPTGAEEYLEQAERFEACAARLEAKAPRGSAS